jgi:hypothetical protein
MKTSTIKFFAGCSLQRQSLFMSHRSLDTFPLPQCFGSHLLLRGSLNFQKDLNERQYKWVSKIQDFEFDIEYVKGKRNIIANALSRRLARCSMMDICTDWKEHLLVEYSKKINFLVRYWMDK